ncbi:MAG: glycosyltransferase family 8 protein [Mesorhizobium sp.]
MVARRRSSIADGGPKPTQSPAAGPIHVACGADDRMVLAALVLATSLAESGTCRSIVFHLLHAPSRYDLAGFAARWQHPHLRIVLHEMPPRYLDLPVAPPYSPAIFFRLGLAEVLGELDRVLYLDADTIVCRDVADLHDTAMDGRPLAAVPDYNLFHFELHKPIPIRDRFGPSLLYLKEELGITYRNAGDYFNSGVLLLDLAAWRRLRLAEACHAFIRGRRLQWPDQDALNVIVGSDYLALDARWNTMAAALENMAVPVTPAQETLRRHWNDDPWIVHYTGTRKPWLFWPRPVPHGDRFWRAAAASPAERPLRAAYRGGMLRTGLGRLAGMLGG